VLLVEVAHGVKRGSLSLATHTIGVVEIQNRLRAATEEYTAISRREEAAREVRGASAGADSRREDGESGQVLRLAAEAIDDPGAERGSAELNRAGEEQKLAGVMVESFGVHRPHEADIVGAGSDAGDVVRQHHAALAVGLELAGAGEDGGGGLDEGELQVLRHRRRQRLAVPFLQAGLGVEEVELTWTALHEKEDDAFGFRGEVRLLGRKRTGGIGADEVSQGERAEASGEVPHELATALNRFELREVHLRFSLWSVRALLARDEFVEVQEDSA
jgi:hypothetical protein